MNEMRAGAAVAKAKRGKLQSPWLQFGVEMGPLILFFFANARPKLFEPAVAAQFVRQYTYLYGAICPQDGACVYLVMPAPSAAIKTMRSIDARVVLGCSRARRALKLGALLARGRLRLRCAHAASNCDLSITR